MLKVLVAALGVMLAGGETLAQDAAEAAAEATPVKTGRCMRLPLSDIAFGEEATIKQAEMRLQEYAAKEQKKRGWRSGSLVKSNQTAKCDVYLVLPFAGTEYKCLVTATFCER
jgi:hypothetical protein